MTIDPVRATALEIARAVAMGSMSARAVTQCALARIEAYNGHLRAFTHVTAERALRQAGATTMTQQQVAERLSSLCAGHALLSCAWAAV